MDNLRKAKKIRTGSIVAICLMCTIIAILASAIMAIVYSINIISNNWNNKELDNEKTLWGILGLLILGPIATLIFANKAISIYSITSNIGLSS